MKALFIFIFMAAGFCLSILTMINGWGLDVESWWWVIAGSLGAIILYAIGSTIAEYW